MQPRRKPGITRNLIYGFGVLILLYAGHAFYSFQCMQRLSDLARTIHAHPLVVSNAALRASVSIGLIHGDIKDMVLFDDPTSTDSVMRAIDRHETDVFKQLDIVIANILGQRGAQLASEAMDLFRTGIPLKEKVLERIRLGDRDAAIRIIRTEVADHVRRLEDKMAALNHYARDKASGFLEESERIDADLARWSLIFSLTWLALASTIAFLTIKGSRQNEAALADEKEKLGVTLKSIGDGVIATDENGAVALMNRVAEQLTGWTEAEALGQPVERVFTIINEYSRENCENPVGKVLASRSVVGLANHTVLVARDGSERAIADSGAPIQAHDGKVIGVVLVFRDQTEDRRYRNRIIESEKKYRLLSDNTVDVIWIMNFDLEFTYVNPAITSITGYTPEEWIGTRLPDHCDEENFNKMATIVANEMAKGEESRGISFEAVMLKKNGDLLPVEIRGRVIYSEDGQPTRLQGVTRDITRRKAAEADREYQARLLQEMGRLAKIGAWEFDPATGQGSWTEEVARIHDLSPGELTSMEHGLGFYEGESREIIQRAVKAAVENGTPYDLEIELVSAKGIRKWVRTIGRPKMQAGRVTHVRGSFQDITERKRFEQRIDHLNRVLRAIRDLNQLVVREKDSESLIRNGCHILVDNRGFASAMIILTDDNDRPRSWARAGLVKASDILNRILEGGKLPRCCEQVRSGVKIVSVTEKEDYCIGCHILEKGRGMHSLAAPLVSDDNYFGCLVVALSGDLPVDDEELNLLEEAAGDIAYALRVLQLDENHKQSEHERVSLERQLVQAQKMESVGRLAGGVAHDYNNMLSVIIGYTELAMDKAGEDSPLMTDLKEILQAANRSSEITRQLLAFARQQTVAPQVLDLNHIMKSMLNMLRRLIGEDIDLAWNAGLDLWPVKIDPVQVDQILANLCVNARDAIVGVGKVTITTENVHFDEAYCARHTGFIPGAFVQLAVSDDGSGMSRETLDKIFEPFFTTKGLGKGTGLGLATVYGIVKQNNGFINVYSEPEVGTTVKIYLPRHADAHVPAADDPPAKIPTGRGETLLLVEDDPEILKLGCKMLEMSGYSVFPAATPGDALALVTAHAGHIDLLITDVVMPEMNGRDLAGKVNDRCPDVRVLFMSGYPANVIAHRGILEEGFNFIQKPFSRRELAGKVRMILDH
ncbi:PAS domain S-box protein [Desulfosarcina ovata]|uniref:histidine kinase n=1 Tax=Desulfosarcina ovata subsp. ovata TaxID=2752305 RepID=A0A5K8AFU0_9BACT|nr:PAS domain S-box protein [Desulfosarcina ovata]BBO91471.1 hypothetical protein DSCOOX_46510 [Desulfosarcina ovata subsp. ovata]